MSILTRIEERNDGFSVSWSFNGSFELEDLDADVNFYSLLEHGLNPKFLFYQNSNLINEADSWDLLKEEVIPIWEEEDTLKVSFILNKTESNDFIVIDESSFISNIPKASEDLIKYWDTIFSNYRTIRLYNEEFVDIELPNFNKLNRNNLFNDLEISRSVSITPDNLFHLIDRIENINSALKKHLQVTNAIFCLKLFSSKYRESNNGQYIFDGYNTCVFEDPNESELLQSFDNLYTIYQWVFSDTNISSKLGILRNLVSLSNSKNIQTCFSHNLLKSLFSNYQVYMKENVKQYFEIKNKVTEFMFDFLNKAIDIQDQYKQSSRNSVLAVLSYFFSVIVIKAINKKNMESLFTPEIASLSIVFIVSAIIYTCIGREDLKNKNNSICTRITELKGRYVHILCEEEIEELFNSESLNKSLNDNVNLNTHLWVNGILIMLLFCVLFFSISNLGLAFFVEHII